MNFIMLYTIDMSGVMSTQYRRGPDKFKTKGTGFTTEQYEEDYCALKCIILIFCTLHP